MDRVQQPAHRRLGLLADAEPEQRLEGVGGVADPGEAVVPVLAPVLRPVRLSGSEVVAAAAIDAARAVQQQLEQQRAALRPRRPTARGRRTAPDQPCQAAIVRSSPASTSRGVDRCSGSFDDAVTPTRCREPRRCGERAVDGLVGDVDLGLAEQAHGQRHVVDAQDDAVHGVVRPGRRGVQAGPRGDREPHRDPAGDPLDPAGQLGPGQPPGDAGVERVGDAHRARRRDVRGLQDVRAGQVAPGRGGAARRGRARGGRRCGRRGGRRRSGRSRGRGSATSRCARRGRRARRCGCRRSRRRSAGPRSRRRRPGPVGRRGRRGRARGRASGPPVGERDDQSYPDAPARQRTAVPRSVLRAAGRTVGAAVRVRPGALSRRPGIRRRRAGGAMSGSSPPGAAGPERGETGST